MSFDRIIVSSDESYFINFWPIVSAAWHKFYPEKKLTLAFLTNLDHGDSFIKKLEEFGDVILFKPVDGIPAANLGQVIRHIAAGMYTDDTICMIEDIDTVPLQREFVDRVVFRQPEKYEIFIVGAEVYTKAYGGIFVGKFPISNLSGSSLSFKMFINPSDLSYEDLIKSWVGLNVYAASESINQPAGKFQDESLLRLLVKRSDGINFTYIPRDVDTKKDWIDRGNWHIDHNRLAKHDYVLCNFLRPISQHLDKVQPIIDFIYGQNNFAYPILEPSYG